MAEQILKMLPDSDGDGIPDIFARLQQDTAFGKDSAQWNNRRKLVFAVIATSWGSCLLMVGIWAYLALWGGGKDIPANIFNFGTTMFWAMNITATTTLATYIGIAQNDTNGYRKQMVDLAKAMPSQMLVDQRSGYDRRGGGYGGYGGYGGGGYGSNTYGGNTSGPCVDNNGAVYDEPDTITPTAPPPATPDTNKTVTRKPGVVI